MALTSLRVRAQIDNAPMRDFPVPAERCYNRREPTAHDVELYARQCFTHRPGVIVAIADHESIVGYVSHNGQRHF